MVSTFCTFSDLLVDGGRLAETVWPTRELAAGVAATLDQCSDAIVLRATNGRETVRGFAPGGLAV